MVSDTYHRRSIRLQGYDYAQAGAYFVTICTQNRECLVGKVVDGEMLLNEAGRIAQEMWRELPRRFPTAEVDQFVVMPNPLHGIIVMVGAQFIAPNTFGRDKSHPYVGITEPSTINHVRTLGEIIRALKAATARQIRLTGFSEFRWQRNYYEHIIRDEKSLNRIREYIATNPLRWELDWENPRRQGEDAFDRWLATFRIRRNKEIL